MTPSYGHMANIFNVRSATPIELLQVHLHQLSWKFVCLYFSGVPATHSLLLFEIYADPTKSCGVHFQSGEAHDFEPIINVFKGSHSSKVS
jgi:hypothetical protein